MEKNRKNHRELFFAMSKKGDWCTPPEVAAPVRKFVSEYYGGIGLDPAGHPMSVMGARCQLTGPQWGGADGLSSPWTGYGLVWLNPSYGKGLSNWTKKVAEESKNGVPCLVLVPASTETDWWALMVPAITATCFWRRRISFVDREFTRDSEDVEPGSTFSPALVYTGKEVAGFCNHFRPHGWCVVPA